jgi:hypothetical protein
MKNIGDKRKRKTKVKKRETVDLSNKLYPGRFTGMSPKMAAIVGYIIDEHYTCPGIASIIVTSDGAVLAMQDGDIGYNEFVGHVSDLERNWKNLLNAAGLTSEEKKYAMRLYEVKIK